MRSRRPPGRIGREPVRVDHAVGQLERPALELPDPRDAQRLRAPASRRVDDDHPRDERAVVVSRRRSRRPRPGRRRGRRCRPRGDAPEPLEAEADEEVAPAVDLQRREREREPRDGAAELLAGHRAVEVGARGDRAVDRDLDLRARDPSASARSSRCSDMHLDAAGRDPRGLRDEADAGRRAGGVVGVGVRRSGSVVVARRRAGRRGPTSRASLATSGRRRPRATPRRGDRAAPRSGGSRRNVRGFGRARTGRPAAAGIPRARRDGARDRCRPAC